MTYQTKFLINGDIVAGDGEAVPVINPATGATICSIAEASSEQVDAAVRAAQEAFPAFAARTPGDRSALLHELANRLEAEREAFGRLESLDSGKPVGAAIEEMDACVDIFRFMAGAVRSMSGIAAGEYMEGYTSMIRRDPVGVVASISPWNYPLMMAAWKLAPPLATGCTMVLKPSELTPLTTLKLVGMLQDIYPKGVVNILSGRGGTTGSQMINHAGIEFISLTGSIRTASQVLQAASSTIKNTHLELGGKAPVIIYDDADVARVIEELKVRIARSPAAITSPTRSTIILLPILPGPSPAFRPASPRMRVSRWARLLPLPNMTGCRRWSTARAVAVIWRL